MNFHGEIVDLRQPLSVGEENVELRSFNVQLQEVYVLPFEKGKDLVPGNVRPLSLNVSPYFLTVF